MIPYTEDQKALMIKAVEEYRLSNPEGWAEYLHDVLAWEIVDAAVVDYSDPADD